MLKISSIKSLTSRRNKRITFRHKSIYQFLHDMSLHRKGLLNSSEYKNEILYKTRKCYLNKNTNFTLTKLSPQKNVYKRAGATINLTHLTHKEQQFSKPFSQCSSLLVGSWLSLLSISAMLQSFKKQLWFPRVKCSKSSGCICFFPFRVLLPFSL